METVVMEQDQLGLQAMALEQTVGMPALVLPTDPAAQTTALVMVPQVARMATALMALAVVLPAEMVVVMVAVAVAMMVAP